MAAKELYLPGGIRSPRDRFIFRFTFINLSLPSPGTPLCSQSMSLSPALPFILLSLHLSFSVSTQLPSISLSCPQFISSYPCLFVLQNASFESQVGCLPQCLWPNQRATHYVCEDQSVCSPFSLNPKKGLTQCFAFSWPVCQLDSGVNKNEGTAPHWQGNVVFWVSGNIVRAHIGEIKTGNILYDKKRDMSATNMFVLH